MEILTYMGKKTVGPDTLTKILSRPDRSFDSLLAIDDGLRQRQISNEVKEQVEIEVKYKGIHRSPADTNREVQKDGRL